MFMLLLRALFLCREPCFAYGNEKRLFWADRLRPIDAIPSNQSVAQCELKWNLIFTE
jgi:hypothetical protein